MDNRNEKNQTVQKGILNRRGYDLWWQTFTGTGMKTGEEKTIVFGLTGTGYFDLVAYEKFHNGQMEDYVPSDEELEKAFAKFPQF